ncbi:MAG: replicative DNA helicase [Clostridia bacterium]|nr:replicative DNA helicase [Clostridia bacterium]
MDDIARKMPASVEAEQSVLGSMLISDECLPYVFTNLTADCFYVPLHREIFGAMQKIFELSNGVIDPVTLIDTLKESGNYDEATGKEYIYNLAKSVPSAANVDSYCEIVKSKYLLRKLIEECGEITSVCYLENEPAESILDLAEQKIFDISERGRAGDFKKLSSAISEEMEAIERMAAAEDKSELMGLQTGFSDLDKIADGFGKGEMIVLAARPGIGKTSFALNIMKNIAQKTGKKCVLFSLEMSNSQLTQRIMASEALIDSRKFRAGNLNPKEWTKLADAAGQLHGCQMLFDDKSGITISEMKSKLRRVDNLGFVVIDYLQLIGSARPLDNRVLEIGNYTRSIKIMAKDLNVPILVLSQLNRETERSGSRPQLSNLRDSGAIEQDADIVMFLYYEKDEAGNPLNENVVNCYVAKNRHGMTGDVKLQFLKEFSRFSSIDTEHEAF